ncbi:MAG: SDR family oxidoreductase [Pseudomonadota bacterium]
MLKPVLVTGASSGIGEATAVHLARKGFNVFAGARRLDALKTLEGLGQGGITAVQLDVTDEGSIKAALAEINDKAGTLYGLVNNAGVAVAGPVEEVPMNEWRRQYETNVFGVVAMAQAVMPQMRAAGAGRIVNIGSLAGRIAVPFMGVYASSKHAVEGISDAMRREFGLHGVKVSLVRPSFVNTPFGAQEQSGLAPYTEEGGAYAGHVAKMKDWHAKQHPHGASPFDVAEAVEDALTAARPHSRYLAPRKATGSLMMRNLLPSAVIDRVLLRVTGVN